MTTVPLTVSRCGGCGSELAATLLSCPLCQRLVHADKLRELSERAGQARGAGDAAREIEIWRDALLLLPATSRQHATIAARIDELGRSAPKPAAEGGGWGNIFGQLGVVGILIAIFSKGKFLLLGLTKGATFFSMLAAFGVYWTAWGWPFAAGLVVSIYIHEMGHVAALHRLGIRATAPMFVPGLGAYVRLKEHPATQREDARVGLAGPWWGLGAAIAAFAIYFATDSKIWGAIGHTGAWINLFNLLPIWQLDGGRGMAPLSRLQRGLLCVTVIALWAITREGLLVLIALGFAYATWKGEKERSDWRIFAEFAALLVILSALTMMKITPAG